MYVYISLGRGKADGLGGKPKRVQYVSTSETQYRRRPLHSSYMPSTSHLLQRMSIRIPERDARKKETQPARKLPMHCPTRLVISIPFLLYQMPCLPICPSTARPSQMMLHVVFPTFLRIPYPNLYRCLCLCLCFPKIYCDGMQRRTLHCLCEKRMTRDLYSVWCANKKPRVRTQPPAQR